MAVQKKVRTAKIEAAAEEKAAPMRKEVAEQKMSMEEEKAAVRRRQQSRSRQQREKQYHRRSQWQQGDRNRSWRKHIGRPTWVVPPIHPLYVQHASQDW